MKTNTLQAATVIFLSMIAVMIALAVKQRNEQLRARENGGVFKITNHTNAEFKVLNSVTNNSTRWTDPPGSSTSASFTGIVRSSATMSVTLADDTTTNYLTYYISSPHCGLFKVKVPEVQVNRFKKNKLDLLYVAGALRTTVWTEQEFMSSPYLSSLTNIIDLGLRD